ncbi:DUF742 domain-containing protein [Actinomadura parmotrematis]|uniref:DUF742 domain-containing protein n=1 Tax=Actinomadura parmotrematis TaxID=2864039 RepID=A0ABS7G343_9ACTN|nr:DUF742 domain-containing protein [Actinomadura parmotrematis]MBW8486630.1 DUF742 domain-containing protein [Actinomadura parmotrematis]
MNTRQVGGEDPDRLYIVTGGRLVARAAAHQDALRRDGAPNPRDAVLDLVTLVVGVGVPPPGLPTEHAAILRLCSDGPLSLAELSSYLALPVTVVKLLLRDLLAVGRIAVRPPVSAPAPDRLPDLETLKQVLVGLQNL